MTATTDQYREAVKQLLDAIDEAGGQSNVTGYDIWNPEPDDTTRPANYAESSWEWALMKVIDDLLAAKKRVLDAIGHDIQRVEHVALPDLIAWPSDRRIRLFATSAAGVRALMAEPSHGRYGVDLLTHHGADGNSELVARLSKVLRVGRCSGEEIATKVAAVAAWRKGGSQQWLP